MAKASEQTNKLEEKPHQCLHLHFHLIFLWPVALCTESIFLTPFPIYYSQTAGRKGKYWLECSLCLLADCTLHNNSDEIAVCFLFVCLYSIWESNDGFLVWLRCDSQYAFISAAPHVPARLLQAPSVNGDETVFSLWWSHAALHLKEKQTGFVVIITLLSVSSSLLLTPN